MSKLWNLGGQTKRKERYVLETNDDNISVFLDELQILLKGSKIPKGVFSMKPNKCPSCHVFMRNMAHVL